MDCAVMYSRLFELSPDSLLGTTRLVPIQRWWQSQTLLSLRRLLALLTSWRSRRMLSRAALKNTILVVKFRANIIVAVKLRCKFAWNLFQFIWMFVWLCVGFVHERETSFFYWPCRACAAVRPLHLSHFFYNAQQLLLVTIVILCQADGRHVRSIVRMIDVSFKILQLQEFSSGLARKSGLLITFSSVCQYH